MDYDTLSKRRLYRTIGWVVVGLWAIFNIALPFLGAPLQTVIIIVPVVNVVLILIWFFFRTLYNIANSKLKHDQKMELYEEDKPLPHYGRGKGAAYIPNITLETELFKSISTEPGKSVLLAASLSDYLKPGRVIVFHDEVDYGVRKEVRVLKVVAREEGVETFFAKLEDDITTTST